MQGSSPDLRIAQCFVLVLLAAAGCEPRLEPSQAAQTAFGEIGRRFHAADCGTIDGQVLWQGDLPKVEDFEVLPNPLAGEVMHHKQTRPNPNLPHIDPKTRGVASAVVFLRHVAPLRSKPWDQAPVQIEQRDCQFHVLQGDTDSPYGFARRGDHVCMISRDRCLHMLQARGSAFFSLAFPDPYQPLDRAVTECGITELTSGAGYYWMRAYLFVDDHPYYTRTDSQGRFEIEKIPAGKYEVVCWHPNWIKARHERDPESGLIFRYYFQPPVKQVCTVVLRAGDRLESRFHLARADFSR
jgi:Polysaccharide lyase family 4, domain II